MEKRYKYLSHILDNNTPTYGNAYNIDIKRTHSIGRGDIANESVISTTTHIGTHIDLPYHFFEHGETIESYEASYWIFDHPLVVELETDEAIIGKLLIHTLQKYQHLKETDLLMVKTGMEKYRESETYWKNNPGFDPALYKELIQLFPKLRAFGFDTISLTAYKHPHTGQKAHKAFLNPDKPFLIIEDMHLKGVSIEENISTVIVAPLRIAQCDGMPCTVIATLDEDSK